MCVFAIGIEDPLMVAMDRLQHSQLREDHRPAVLYDNGFCRARLGDNLADVSYVFRWLCRNNHD